MFTMITAAAIGLLWLLAIGIVIIMVLCTYIVWAIASDIYRTYKIKKERRGNCS